MTYWRYWQLSGAPFTGSQNSPLFRGASVEEAIARFEFLITNRRHVGSLIGPSGVGKSSLLRFSAANPPRSIDVPNIQAFRVSMLGLDKGELFANLAIRLTGSRIDSADLAAGNRGKTEVWQLLSDHFRAADREGVHTVLLVDDTESSSRAAEGELCRLLAAEFPLTVIFAVERELAASVNPSFYERTELQIELPGWDVTQTAEFLAWTFQRLGRSEPIFTDNAVERIQQRSEGLARRIIQLSDLALVAGAVSQSDYIDADCIEQVACELPQNHAA